MAVVQTIDQSAQNATWGAFVSATTPGVAQTFTSLGGTLKRVELAADWTFGTGPIEYRILIVAIDGPAGGFSPGQVLARSGVQNLPIDTDNAPSLLTADFAGVALTAGTRYAIVLDTSPSADVDNAALNMSIIKGPGLGPDYTGGSAFFYSGGEANFFSANWSSAADYDLSFKLTYGSNAAPVNSLPTTYVVDEDGRVDLSGLTVSDADGDVLTTTVTYSSGFVGISTNGASVTFTPVDRTTFKLSGTASAITAALVNTSFTPSNNFSGGVTLSFSTTDGVVTTDTSTVISVRPVNDQPRATADLVQAVSYAAITGDVRNNDQDVDGPRSSLSVLSFGGAAGVATPDGTLSGVYGRLTLTADGRYDYVLGAPEALKAGDVVQDVFNYVIGDAAGGAAQTTLTFRITGRSVGGVGDDAIVGNDGANRLEGLGGNDVLSGAGGDDRLAGGTGVNQLNGGPGFDLADYSARTSDLYVDMLNRSFSDTTTYDTFSSIEGVIGGAGADQLYGAATGDRLYGGAGNDALIGRGGDDRLGGGTGVNWLDGGNGVDLADYSDRTTALYVDLNNGSFSDASTYDQFNAIEGVFGGSGGDQLYGTAGGNRLYGGAGNDVLSGRDGDDRLGGGVGLNALDGGSGIDLADYSDRISGIYVDLSNGSFSDATTYDAFTSIEGVVGGAGVDFLLGAAGDDFLFGQGGNDVLIGRDGQDWLYGEAGADRLDGGAGHDHLTGGAGADVFDFSGGGWDTVMDFSYDAGDRFALGGGTFQFAVVGDYNGDGVLDTQLTWSGGTVVVLSFADGNPADWNTLLV